MVLNGHIDVFRVFFMGVSCRFSRRIGIVGEKPIFAKEDFRRSTVCRLPSAIWLDFMAVRTENFVHPGLFYIFDIENGISRVAVIRVFDICFFLLPPLPSQIQTLKKISFMKNTIDLPSSILRRRGFLMRFNLSKCKMLDGKDQKRAEVHLNS
jgi:hypothetical protein